MSELKENDLTKLLLEYAEISDEEKFRAILNENNELSCNNLVFISERQKKLAYCTLLLEYMNGCLELRFVLNIQKKCIENLLAK